MERIGACERWLVRRGVPHLIDDYDAGEDIWTWALPVLVVLYAAITIRLWRTGRRAYAALFGLATLGMIFVAGEEISWGQRLLGLETPDDLEEINKQGETNLHNIGGVLAIFNIGIMIVSAICIALPIARWTVWRSARPTLERYPPSHVRLSFSGATRASHDAVRGRDSFSRVLQAVAVLTSRRIPTSFSMVVDRACRDELQEAVELTEGLGVLGISFILPQPSTGSLELGPNAVLALDREGYRRSDVTWEGVRDLLTSPEFWRLARRHWRTGAHELRGSMSVRAYMERASRYVPAITAADVVRGGAGVRAQAVGRDGSLVDDFLVEQQEGVTTVRNAPSPAATSSMAIAELVADRVLGNLRG